MSGFPEALRSDTATPELTDAVLLSQSPADDRPPYDPLLNFFDLPLQQVFYPRGFPVLFQTNNQEVLDAANESWGDHSKRFPVPQIRVQVGILPAPTHPFTIPISRSRENLISTIADPQNFSLCDLQKGYGFCWLSEHAVRNHGYLRYYFLEAAALNLVTAKYLTPVHGACVAWRGKGVLLCGDSGAGKSSLSFACARRGWTFLSDDASCLLRGRQGRVVIGNPQHIHFRESAFELFPELRSIPLRPRINGDISIELATAECKDIATAHETEVDFVLFLNRQISGSPSISVYSPDGALANLSQFLCYGDAQQLKEQKQSLTNLLSAEVLEFRYSDLDSGVDFMRRLVEGEV